MAIEVRSLSKRYGSKSAVNDASFEVQGGRVTGFLGPNGAGKSTTMRLMVGLDRPSSGEALIDGQRYAGLRLPLRQVGALLDAKSAHRSRTAVNHLRAVAATHGIGRARVDEVIDLAGLTSVARKRVGSFSLGMSQRVGIAVALLGDPGTLILDEPVNGLDPDGVTWMRELLRGLAAEGRTVFLSSHLLTELALVASHVIVIGRGRILADTPVDALTHGTSVRVRTDGLNALKLILTRAGGTFVVRGDDTMDVGGLEAEDIARIAAEHDIVLFEVTPVGRTLEEAYRELTRGAVEYEATGASSRDDDIS
ncbi:ATP-binding cassette domain-containing protein [Microbacterium sp. BH-3-3-3]|uniref:ATP-binding cassette domain-containing protein n=1 Tax=Microbacterium sp. BH-3-3-3 TaxID=1906742 RepID=UPI000A86E254|nr:ATP-binding cassette domain-containing protein [Microbacterium sp. BH-3-3-3]